MSRLKTSLVTKYEGKHVNVHSPKNTQKVDLEFKSEKIAKVVGLLAAPVEGYRGEDEKPNLLKGKEGSIVSGVLVHKNFAHTIMASSDLATFTELKTTTLVQKLTIPFHQTFFMLHSSLKLMYENLELSSFNEQQTVKILGMVTVSSTPQSQVIVEWNSNPINDMVADSVISMILYVESNPASIKALPPKILEVKSEFKQEAPSRNFDNEKRVLALLEAQFGTFKVISQGVSKEGKEGQGDEPEQPHLVVHLSWGEGEDAEVDITQSIVRCESQFLRERLEVSMARGWAAVSPVSDLIM